MKVLIVGPIKTPIIARLASHLREKGIEVVVASHNAQNCEGVIDLGKVSGFWSYLNFFKVYRVVRQVNPDLVHSHIVNHYGLMSLFQHKPLLVALWGSDIMLAPNQGSRIKRGIFRWLNWIVLKRASRCHTSGFHVAEEAEKQCKGTLAKTDVFYWGLPLQKPCPVELNQIEQLLKTEFGIEGEGFVVFPRGLSPVYNPRASARIINKLLKETSLGKKIIVLKALATEEEEVCFTRLVDVDKIVYIDRMLNASELYFIYSRSNMHFSIPLSDSLGGGVIEPSLLGSYPVLSDLPSYRKYLVKNPGMIMKDFSETELDALVRKMNQQAFEKTPAVDSNEYNFEQVIGHIMALYNKTCGLKS